MFAKLIVSVAAFAAASYLLFISFVSPYGSGKYHLRRAIDKLVLLRWRVRSYFFGTRALTDRELVASLRSHSSVDWEIT